MFQLDSVFISGMPHETFVHCLINSSGVSLTRSTALCRVTQMLLDRLYSALSAVASVKIKHLKLD